MNYKYFVSYTHSQGSGFNVFEITGQIKSYEDIFELKKTIENKNENIHDVIIMNIQRLPI